MQAERSLGEPKRRARFSPLPMSTPLLSFDVLEWIPNSSESLARLPVGRAASVYPPDSRASVAPSEGRVHPRDCTAFESSCGSWTCFRTLSRCGDALVLEDAQLVDVGAARRHGFTWQQGPDRLPSGGVRTGYIGASAGCRRTLASVSENAMDIGADIVPRDSLLADRRYERPAPPAQCRKRGIPMQDIHSVCRHCFQKPVTLVFDARGHSISARDSADTTARGDRAKRVLAQSRHHRSSGLEMALALQWRYELWGPVGVIFTLRGGRRIFLAFASTQHAEQIVELLASFATGAELGRRQPSDSSPHRSSTGASASFSQVPAWSAGDDIPFAASASGPHAAPLSSGGLQRCASPSCASVHIASCEASLRGAPATPCSPQAGSAFSSAWASGAPWLVSSTPAGPQTGKRWRKTGSFTDENSPSPLSDTVPASQEVGGALAARARRDSSRVPGGGYLYCRPWGEASRYLRYYLRVCTTAGRSHVVHLSRHRLRLWQRLRQVFGNERRTVSLDLRRASVCPSAAHENLLRVTYQAESFAQYKSLQPLGGGVVFVGPVSDFAASRAARRRELELCADYSVVFEALAKSPEERTSWLAFFCSRGAAVQAPVDAAQLGDYADVLLTPEKPVAFQQLGGESLLATSPASGPGQEMLLSSTADQCMPTWETPTFSAEAVSSLKPLSNGSPHLPLKEQSEGRRGGCRAAAETAAALRLSTLYRTYPSNVSPSLPERHPAADEHASTLTSPSPLSAVAAGTGDRQEEEEELTIVVEDDELDRTTPCPEAAEPHSPGYMMQSDPSTMDHTATPPRRTSASPVLDEGGRWLRSGTGRAVEAPNIMAAANESSKAHQRLANTRLTMAGTIVAPMYLEDTTSSEVSSHERLNALPPQLPAKYETSKIRRGAGETLLDHTAAAQGALGTPLFTVEVNSAGRHTPVATANGSATPVPLKAPSTVVASASVLAEEHLRRSRSSNGVNTPPRTSELETAAFTTTTLGSLVVGLSQRMWQTPNRSLSLDAPLDATPPAALRNGAEKPAPTGTKSSSAPQAPPASLPGMMTGHRLRHQDAINGLVDENHTMHDTLASCSPAPSSGGRPGKGDGDTDDARGSDASSSSFSTRDRDSLSSSSSAVDPRLSQFLEPYVNETSLDQVGGRHRGDGVSIGVPVTPFDLHLIPPREYRGNRFTALRVPGEASAM
ncbi:hypothetical protein LMJF_30_1950 [Leishmania major strain Friedlin]|uniref:Uncharacterized protein n=1 Tax=Leishmania major TaxID=5664 RepID=Q4Q7A1_LEIMA|nr:hypothetical protein LMJF_30_1950 [Leishmania major strain Friedlin]CAG9578426.1 hypothetical_protein_-_conserved [Leishmania major strain Friedlin]CAJ06366.1 hypothetical protein LMJF_30_1950 [Leishmania major strain Friedlin]|eukprot:XP_001684797.1 hypothetical protein LMJF_30_1950 [Leishmania major strain Friedlin]